MIARVTDLSNFSLVSFDIESKSNMFINPRKDLTSFSLSVKLSFFKVRRNWQS